MGSLPPQEYHLFFILFPFRRISSVLPANIGKIDSLTGPDGNGTVSQIRTQADCFALERTGILPVCATDRQEF